MKISLLDVMSETTPKISILSGKIQLFQGSIDDFSCYFESNISRSEALLVPHDAHEWNREYREYVSRYAKQKPIIFFNTSDRPRREKIPNAFSLQSSHMLNHLTKTIIIPYNVQSLSFLTMRSKSAKPSLSFVGYIPNFSLGRIARSFKDNPLKPWEAESSLVRKRAVKNMLLSFPDARVLPRQHYGGAKSLITDPKIFRAEYVSSILESDLVLCPRGDANSSQRYYEVLSAGRIPVVPKTGVSLPEIVHNSRNLLHLNIDVFARDIKEVVDEFWSAIGDDQYQNLQVRLRNYFRENLSYNSFLHKFFKSDINDLNVNFCYNH